jgi:hypothetical protein
MPRGLPGPHKSFTELLSPSSILHYLQPTLTGTDHLLQKLRPTFSLPGASKDRCENYAIDIAVQHRQ